MTRGELAPSDRRFAAAAVRRERLFLALSGIGVGVAGLLVAYYGYRRWLDPTYPLGLRAVIVVLVLLNARQNLRQYRYARILSEIGRG